MTEAVGNGSDTVEKYDSVNMNNTALGIHQIEVRPGMHNATLRITSEINSSFQRRLAFQSSGGDLLHVLKEFWRSFSLQKLGNG